MFKPGSQKMFFSSDKICMWHLRHEKIPRENSLILILTEKDFLFFDFLKDKKCMTFVRKHFLFLKKETEKKSFIVIIIIVVVVIIIFFNFFFFLGFGRGGAASLFQHISTCGRHEV